MNGSAAKGTAGAATAQPRRSDIQFVIQLATPSRRGIGSSAESSSERCLNIPLGRSAGDAEWQAALESTALPWIRERAPDVVVLSCGFDAHGDDALVLYQYFHQPERRKDVRGVTP